MRDKVSRRIIQLFYAALFALAGSIAFQWMKHALSQTITPLQSAISTIFFYTVLTAAASFFLFRREMNRDSKVVDGKPVSNLTGKPLEDVNNLLQGLVQASPLAVVVLDPDGYVPTLEPRGRKIIWLERRGGSRRAAPDPAAGGESGFPADDP